MDDREYTVKNLDCLTDAGYCDRGEYVRSLQRISMVNVHLVTKAGTAAFGASKTAERLCEPVYKDKEIYQFLSYDIGYSCHGGEPG